MASDAERIGIAYITHRTGVSKRLIQDKAARGDIPTAAKIFGGKWSFDRKAIDDWVAQKINEGEPLPWKTIIRAKTATTIITSRELDEAYKRAIWE